ncbi:MAG: thiamine phosphate synthase [Pseudomonadota bacterium]|nr:thiamine phosphate synthase [Pseudomonadota bacterium]
MSPFALPPGLYGIVEPTLGDPLEQARMLCDEGAAVVQLRCKGWPAARLLALAEACRALPIVVIVNDNASVAAAVGLPVHLGQDDGADPRSPASQAAGGIPFGRSTHTLEQAATPGGAAYIGFGPVFGTDSKATPWSARGVELLARAVCVSPVPVVAIGGITVETLPDVRAAGAHGWAVIGAIWRAPDPRAAIRALSS